MITIRERCVDFSVETATPVSDVSKITLRVSKTASSTWSNMKISELKANPKNPRKISDTERAKLSASLEEFGDLGSVVFNEQTGRLVGGHQRSKALKDAIIKIVNKYDPPTKTGTVADGYAMVGEEKFSYRVVRWSESREMEALLAANKIQGQWDTNLLRVAIADTPGLNLSVAGFSIPELRGMGIEFKMPNIPPVNSGQVIREEEQTDEQYVAENPGPDSGISKENIDMVNRESNPFETVEEVKEAPGRRFVLIIDCQNNEHKDALKEKIRPLVIEAGGKFF